MTAHQDVAGLVAILRDDSDHYVADWAREAMHHAADRLESLSRALSEAEAERVETNRQAVYLADRIAEAMKVIEPFALIAEHDIGSDEADSDTYRPMTYNTVPHISVGHLRAARRFLNAGKE